MAHGYSLKKGIQSYLSSDGWVNILSGMVTQTRWRTGWGCESLSIFKVEYNFLFTLLQSLEWGKRGREREKVGHQSSFVHISRKLPSFRFHLYYRTVICYLFGHQQILYKSRSELQFNQWSLLVFAWVCTHTGKEVATGADMCSETERVCRSPSNIIASIIIISFASTRW